MLSFPNSSNHQDELFSEGEENWITASEVPEVPKFIIAKCASDLTAGASISTYN